MMHPEQPADAFQAIAHAISLEEPPSGLRDSLIRLAGAIVASKRADDEWARERVGGGLAKVSHQAKKLVAAIEYPPVFSLLLQAEPVESGHFDDLPHMLNALIRLVDGIEVRKGGGRDSYETGRIGLNPRELCACVVAEAWLLYRRPHGLRGVRRRPSASSITAHRIAEMLWRTCELGKTGNAEQGVSGWRNSFRTICPSVEEEQEIDKAMKRAERRKRAGKPAEPVTLSLIVGLGRKMVQDELAPAPRIERPAARRPI